MPRLTIRIDLDDGGAIGPGKIALLEAVDREGSIAAAARCHGMSYARAWRLVSSLNKTFDLPVLTRQPGGARGGGAALTDFGRELIERYRAVEAAAHGAACRDMARLQKIAAKQPPPGPRPLKKPPR
jgi:molybdate transport system regulatory protein